MARAVEVFKEGLAEADRLRAEQEISRNVQQAAAGTATIATEIAGVMTAAGSTGEAAAVVLSTASDLSSRSTELSGEVDQFLATVRAA